ncbi:hypothetical protein N7603_08815, partial [Acholeplasma vituli]
RSLRMDTTYPSPLGSYLVFLTYTSRMKQILSIQTWILVWRNKNSKATSMILGCSSHSFKAANVNRLSWIYSLGFFQMFLE